MSHSHPRRLNGLFGKRAPKERRPSGVSRRAKRQFTFEPLEDRRVMAEGSGGNAGGWVDNLPRTYFSTNTIAGTQAIYADEMNWAAMIAGASAAQPRTSFSIPTDPMLAHQWHLINTGQEVGSPDWQPIYGVPGNDVNVAPVWMMNNGLGYTGAGVTVAVIDSGVQTNHPDLLANISTTVPGLNVALSGSNANPTPNQPSGPHGTAVAGIIAAVANNGIGGAGIAPGASIVPIRFLAPTQNLNATVDAFRYRIQDIDITNNSWGSAAERTLSPLSQAEVNALRDSVIFGRGGLGVIHVFASGNSAGSSLTPGFGGQTGNDSSIYDGFQNSRYTITVGGYDHDGKYLNEDGTITAYPEAGANVLIVAPTGSNANQVVGDDANIGSGIYTTDQTGTFTNGLGGYNVPPHPTQGEVYDRDFYPDGNYTSRFNGTSAAAPMVSGVIALMLEANPNLTWRDVQEILLRSARQVAAQEDPSNGAGVTTNNTWFVNQQGMFQDPDDYDPELMLGFLDTHFPTLDPVLNQPLKMANGAGYTVSQGYGPYGEQIGYGHGAVDAEMAVQLAEQWHTKGQNLAPERTFTTNVAGFFPIQKASKGNQDSGYIVVPGAFGIGEVGIDYWNEYFADEPFSDDDPPVNRRGIPYREFSVPASNRMSVESVEVKVNIRGGTKAALDNMRLVLVSPSGTHSELNHYFYGMGTPGYYQNAIPGNVIGDPGSSDNGGDMIWSFTTNRSWGELTDDALILDPLTGEPLVDPDTGEPTGETKGWRLYMENWSDTEFSMSLSMSWHGQPVAASAQRIQGAVGIDDNDDGEFNYSRVITEQLDIDDNPDVLRIGELFTIADPDQERFAGNVTVVAKRKSDGFIVDRFVTGADGNYYFDLAPGEYEISVEDPLGRTALVDTLTVTNDSIKKDVNFLLDPGTTASPEAQISGNVLADVNGDGISNGDDVPGAGISIYVDANRNGIRDTGELTSVTDANGNYEIIVPNITGNTVVDVRAQLPTGWTAVNPVNALSTLLLRQGVSIESVNFALKPPANGGGGGGGEVDPTTPASLIGYVFADTNQNQLRDSTELGMAGIRVYIDANNDRVYNDGEATTFTNSQGAYTFSVAAGQHRIRVVAATPYLQTTPTTSFGTRVVNVVAGGTLSGIAFGLYNSANYDYGDLPDSYDLVNNVLNRPKHKKSNYWLGTRWDGELGAHPSANADGDDTTEYDDDDGIQFLDPIVAGATVRLTATANRYNGYLKGWIDWNNNGKFDTDERLTFSGIGSPSDNVLLQEGDNVLTIQVPANISASVTQVYARFRFGEQTTDVTSETPVAGAINTPYGVARVGEVEDYRFTVTPSAVPAIIGVPSDFDGNDRVDGSDFLAWQRGFGKTQATVTDGDATRDGKVDQFDLQSFKNEYGEVAPETAAPVAAASVQAASSAALVSEEETVVEQPSMATFEIFASDVSSQPALQSDLASLSVRDAAAGRFEPRPVWSAIAGKLTDVADRLRQRADSLGDKLDEGRDFVVELLHDVADRVDNFDFESVRRDRAFDDLFGSRRRQGLKIEAEAEAGEENDADDVFAIFADHFEVPRG